MKLSDFGLREGINEVIAVTYGVCDEKNADGINTAPIGVMVDDESGVEARVRLFKSHTRENVERSGRIYVNVIRDPMVFVISAFEDLPMEYFLEPPVLKNALSICEFKAEIEGGFAELTLLSGKVFAENIMENWRAVNRGFSAVIEGLVYATRLPHVRGKAREEIEGYVYHYWHIVQRCGGKRERRAYEVLMDKLRDLGLISD